MLIESKDVRWLLYYQYIFHPQETLVIGLSILRPIDHIQFKDSLVQY